MSLITFLCFLVTLFVYTHSFTGCISISSGMKMDHAPSVPVCNYVFHHVSGECNVAHLWNYNSYPSSSRKGCQRLDCHWFQYSRQDDAWSFNCDGLSFSKCFCNCQ